MKEFEALIEVANILNGEKGCPWDQKQTFASLCPYVLEEAHEVLDAVDGGNNREIIEELGDLLYTVIFYSKVAERQSRFSLRDILDTLRQKLVRRHPHVFGDADSDIESIKSNWEKIKQQEKGDRTSPLDGIPKTLPLLMRVQKVLHRMHRQNVQRHVTAPSSPAEELAARMLNLLDEATRQEIDAESALRKSLSILEKDLHSSKP